jgi:hypothetical protein
MMAFLIQVGSVLAHEGESHGEPGMQKVTGEVVDLACYLGHGAMGAGHRDCAQKCISSGLPVGIKSGDRVYLAMGSEHTSANATLAPLAAKQVEAEGIVTERDGVHLIVIQKVKIKE